MFKHAGISLISASLLLAGCGGGSSSSDTPADTGLTYDGPTAAVVISDQTTADGVAGSVIGMESGGSTTFSDATNIITFGVATNVSSGGSSVNNSELATMAKKLTDRAFSSDAGPSNLLAGLTRTQTSQCDPYNGSTGNVTMTATVSTLDSNNNWVPTENDTFSMTFSSCYEAASQELINGSASFTLQTISILDPVSGEPTEFSASFNFANLKGTNTASGDYTWLNGGFTAGFNGDGSTNPFVFSVTGNSMIVQDKAAGVTQTVKLTNFSFVDTVGLDGSFTIDHDYTVACTTLGGSVTVEMTTPFIIYQGDNNPSIGVVVVSGDLGASIKLTAIDNLTAQIEYDLNGDGIYGNGADPVLKVVYWTDLG